MVTHYMADFLFCELSQLAVVVDEVYNSGHDLVLLFTVLQVVHEHVQQLPGFWFVFF